jgi:multiple sugar transport system ATP-binding protein
MACVEFRDIQKIYPEGSAALRGISLGVEDGELMVFVGPSGCGKSTLLRLLAGLEEVSSGEILIDGDRVNDWSPQRRNIAMVFQNYALYPHMTVRQNLAFPLRMRRLPKPEIDHRVSETARLLGLTALLERRPKQLSGGQRQRVAMGRAVVRNPSVFLMDEPLSNLDAKLRVQIRTEIAALQQRLQATTIYVTHDQVEAMTLGQRVAVLQEGALQQVDSPQRLYHRPANAFVASFLGNPGMNLFPARLSRQAGSRLALEMGEQCIALEGTVEVAAPLDQPLIAGIRPEALTPIQASGNASGLHIVVDTVESLGHERLIYGHLPGLDTPASVQALDYLRGLGNTPEQLVARLPGDYPISAGTALALAWEPQRLYLFDAAGTAYTPHGETMANAQVGSAT